MELLTPHINAALKNPESMSVFGLILFTDRHPSISRILADEFNWQAYSALTGPRFAVFSAKPEAPKGFMQGTWREPQKNHQLLKCFNLQNTKGLPKFVVFTRLPGDEILQYAVQLTDQSDIAAHQRLMEVFEFVGTIADGIAQENQSNAENVFYAFENQLREFAERETIMRLGRWIPFVQKIIGLVS